jgi:hypothetical protein
MFTKAKINIRLFQDLFALAGIAAFLPGIPKYSHDLEVMVLQLQNYQVQFT